MHLVHPDSWETLDLLNRNLTWHKLLHISLYCAIVIEFLLLWLFIFKLKVKIDNIIIKLILKQAMRFRTTYFLRRMTCWTPPTNRANAIRPRPTTLLLTRLVTNQTVHFRMIVRTASAEPGRGRVLGDFSVLQVLWTTYRHIRRLRHPMSELNEFFGIIGLRANCQDRQGYEY